MKTVERGQYFITLDTERTERNGTFMQTIFAAPLRSEISRARGWIRKNAYISPVLNGHVFHHEDRYSIEIQVRSLFQDRTASWAQIVNGIEKYVNETTEPWKTKSMELWENLLQKQDLE